MGNSTSHSVQLAQTRLSLRCVEEKERKYASPQNRVLPAPASVQKLRCTDNGTILQSGGTLTGRKIGENIIESEINKLLGRRCHMNIYGHRKSHSDPDIVQRMMISSSEEDYEAENGANRKSIIAISPSKAKIKSRKKSRAPEPPHSNTLPRDSTRSSLNNTCCVMYQRKNNIDSYLPPPPPPPPPDYNKESEEKNKNVLSNYEKNKRPKEKWKLSKNLDACKEENKKPRSLEKIDGRSRFSKEGKHLQSMKVDAEEELKHAIFAAYKRKGSHVKDKKINKRNERNSETNLKHYYFTDVECLKSNSDIEKHDAESKTRSTHHRLDNSNVSKAVVSHTFLASDQLSPITKVIEYNQTDLQPSQCCEEKSGMKTDKRHEVYHYNKTSDERIESSSAFSWSEDDEMDIDLQLRPILPKRQFDISKFSPTEVWKSIVIDAKSHQGLDPSSDEGDVLEDRIQHINKPVAPKRSTLDRCEDSGISPDDGSPLLQLNKSRSGRWIPLEESRKPAWIPQQDLLDDSEEETPRKNGRVPQVVSVQPKFTLSNNMFLGQKCKDQESSSKGSNKSRCHKKKMNKNGDNFNSLRNLKKVFGFRTKSPLDNQKGLDANWSLSRSLPDFINKLQIVEKPIEPCKSPHFVKEEKVRRNGCLSTPSLVTKQKAKELDRIKDNEVEYSSQGHVMYLPEYETTNIEERDQKKKRKDKKKFSYQSTVRKVERKVLEEKLSKEIKQKEIQREREKEWMKKVEEEFKRQREKEKSKEFHSEESKNGYNNQSSDDRWKHLTGMSKWLRRSPQKAEIRPEPEGGRSSGDEGKKTEMNHSKQNNQIECKRNRNINTKDQLSADEDDIIQEEYGIHTEIRRTGSGRTFQSHSYYMIESHEELYDDIKEAKMQTLDVPKSKSRLPGFKIPLELRENVRKKVKAFEVQTRRKKSSLDDSESPSDEEYVPVCDSQIRQKHGKRWEDSLLPDGNGSSPDRYSDSPIGFSRNHPLRNGARVKIQGQSGYRTNRDIGEKCGYPAKARHPSSEKKNGYIKRSPRERQRHRNEVYQLI